MSQKNGNLTIIRVVRKDPHGGGHHGGSWKVAYADFVTAMMAFFLVMWIMGMDSQVKDLIEGYFANPVGFKRAYSGGSTPMSMGNSPMNPDIRRLAMLSREHQREQFEQVKQRIQEGLAESPQLKKLQAQVDIAVTRDGLRVELVEADAGETFFAFGSTELKPGAREVLHVIAQELQSVPNEIVLEGHTDAVPYGTPGYSNWELSVDRANAARRMLLSAGVTGERISGVRGYADRMPRVADRFDPANRRVTILMPFAEMQVPAVLAEPG